VPFEIDRMNLSCTSGGTRQKSYVFPLMKRTFMRFVDWSYPIANIADEDTRIISMGRSFREKTMRLESVAYHRGMARLLPVEAF
jgi:hypothetical protein